MLYFKLDEAQRNIFTLKEQLSGEGQPDLTLDQSWVVKRPDENRQDEELKEADKVFVSCNEDSDLYLADQLYCGANKAPQESTAPTAK